MTREEAIAISERLRAGTHYDDRESTDALLVLEAMARAFGPMLEALEAVAGLGVECVRDGRTAPAEGCDCDTCHDFAEVHAALALARKAAK